MVTESVRGVWEIKTLGIKNNLLEDMKEIIRDLFHKSEKEIDIWKKFHFSTRILKALLEVSIFCTCVILLYYK